MKQCTSTIVNIKCSTRVQTKNLLNSKSLYSVKKSRKNFYVLRFPSVPYVLCIFRNYVNISGIKHLVHLPHVKTIVSHLFDINDFDLHIDNLTAKICTPFKNIFLPHLTDFISNNQIKFKVKSVRFDPETFCALIIRFGEKPWGTLLLFNSGKCVSVGCKTEANLLNATLQLDIIWNQYELHS